MKYKLIKILNGLGNKLGIYRFSAKYFANYPRLTRVFNNGLPVAMVLAVVIGLGVLSWQIVSLAKSGEIHVMSPRTDVSGNFEAEMSIKASQNRKPFHVQMKIDDTTVDSRVSPARYPDGDAIRQGDSRSYKFGSGINGENKFNVNLLKPGKHTMTIRAATGTEFGQGSEIDEVSQEFTVKSTTNLAALNEPAKTFTTAQVAAGLGATPRSAEAPLPGLKNGLAGLNRAIFPKAEAHSGTGKRHGNINVYTKDTNGNPVPAVAVNVFHPALDGCHGADINSPASLANNSKFTESNGLAQFFNCPVSNIGEDSATYTVGVGPTPAGYSITSAHERTMTVRWNQYSDINFIYNPPAPTPTAPAAPAAPAVPATPSYNFTPGDKPLVSVTAITPNAVMVDAFAMKMVNNGPVNNLREVVAYVDGARVATINSGFSLHATQAGLVLNLPGINLADGQLHEVAIQVVTQNEKNSILNFKVNPPAAGNTNPNGTGGTPAGTPATDGKGAIQVTAYGHSKAGQSLDKDKDPRVGYTYVAVDNLDNGARKCDKANGFTNADRGNKDGFGKINFKDCPSGTYKLTMVMAKEFRSDPAFNAQISATDDGQQRVTRTVHVKKDKTTEASFLLIGESGSIYNPNKPSNGTGGTPAPDEKPTPSADKSKPYPETGPNSRGLLHIYTEKGRYDRVVLGVDTVKPTVGGVPSNQAACDWTTKPGQFRPSDYPGDRHTFTVATSTEYFTTPCTLSSFYVNFLRPGQPNEAIGPKFDNPRIAVTPTANHCTYIKKSGITRVAPLNNEGKCPSVSDLGIKPDREESKLTARYNPSPTIIGQSYTYEHELSLANGQSMSAVECAGDIQISHIPDPSNTGARSYPLRYWFDTTTSKGRCTFKQQISASYSKTLNPIKEKLKLEFRGNIYLKPSEIIIDNNRLKSSVVGIYIKNASEKDADE